jgi:hypothetical protein
MDRRERGQATPLLALLVLAVGGLIFGLARFGATATHAAQSQAAADAAALAGAAEDRDAAEELAAANGGEVATYEQLGTDVQVRVRLRDTWAVARARRSGGDGSGGLRGWVGQSSAGGLGARLPADVRDALEAAAALLHQPVPIADVRGRSFAVPRSFAARLSSVAQRVGLCRLSSPTDPIRFEACLDPSR